MLVKHGLRCIRVHPCNLQLRNNNIFENISSFPSDKDSSTSSLEKGLNIVTDSFQNVSFDIENMFGNENIFPIDRESGKK